MIKIDQEIFYVHVDGTIAIIYIYIYIYIYIATHGF